MSSSRPISESPWFWMLLYSTVPLVGLALLSHKYAERQSRLERQYQGRMDAAVRASERVKAGEDVVSDRPAENVEEATPLADYSTPDDTIIPLMPLTFIFLAVACFAAVMLARERGVFGGKSAGASVEISHESSP